MDTEAHIALIEQLFKTYHSGLVAYAHSLLRSPEDAREVVQEVFLGVWNNREQLDQQGNIKAYLFTATRNKCFNFLQKRRLSTQALDAAAFALETGEPGADARLEAAELRADIFDEVRRLPEKCREIFLLSRRDQLSYREIAEKTGLSEKTVENQIGIALKRIRLRLMPNPPDRRQGPDLPERILLLLPAGNLLAGLFRQISLFFRQSREFHPPAWGAARRKWCSIIRGLDQVLSMNLVC